MSLTCNAIPSWKTLANTVVTVLTAIPTTPLFDRLKDDVWPRLGRKTLSCWSFAYLCFLHVRFLRISVDMRDDQAEAPSLFSYSSDDATTTEPPRVAGRQRGRAIASDGPLTRPESPVSSAPWPVSPYCN